MIISSPYHPISPSPHLPISPSPHLPIKQANAQRDSALLRILDRIGQQIEQHLPQLAFIASEMLE